jgi:hypothetical protein
MCSASTAFARVPEHPPPAGMPLLEIISPLVMIMLMAKTVVTRILLGAGTVTVFPTKKRTTHLILQAVGLQS